MSVHTMGAAILSVPELVLDAKEAAHLAEAISNVAQFYDVPADPKTVAWVNLAMAGMSIYGTRALAYSNRMRRERMEAQRNLPAPQPPAAAGGVRAGTPSAAAAAPPPRANGGAAAAAAAMQSHLGAPPVGE